MRQLAQSGLGILLVTHHVAEIIPEIERVVLMREGRIVADAPKEQVLNSAMLSGIFGVQVQVARHHGYFHLY
jgi:iron complex transport system ATP-binding protein